MLIQDLTRQAILELLARTRLGRLACTQGAQPYVVPVHFAYDDNALYGFATVGQLLRPFPQYFTISTSCCLENLGQSTYHALEAKVERRFRNGLNLLASYTLSKTLTDADSSFATETGFNSNVFGAQNPYNLNGEKVYPVAYALAERHIPFLFVSGYGENALPPGRSDWKVCVKPFKINDLAAVLSAVMLNANTGGPLRTGAAAVE